MQRETVIREYFAAWVNNDISAIDRIFAENVTYSECYGPEYRGLTQILQWFSDWNKTGRVLEWTIKRFVHQDSTTVVEWFFKCDYDGIACFDGVSIVDFDDEMKIVSLKEFQSKAEHYFPYE